MNMIQPLKPTPIVHFLQKDESESLYLDTWERFSLLRGRYGPYQPNVGGAHRGRGKAQNDERISVACSPAFSMQEFMLIPKKELPATHSLGSPSRRSWIASRRP